MIVTSLFITITYIRIIVFKRFFIDSFVREQNIQPYYCYKKNDAAMYDNILSNSVDMISRLFVFVKLTICGRSN